MSTADLDGPKVIVNPEDFANGRLAEAKAAAATYGATIVANPYCPKGRVFAIDLPAGGKMPPAPNQEGTNPA